jgi:hypothetical protein
MSRRQEVADQLKGLLERHQITPADIERLTGESGKSPISAVTVRRILKGEARTEPEPVTLRRIAESVGEGYMEAFPEKEEGPDRHKGGSSRFFLRFTGAPPPDGLEGDLRKVIERYEKKRSR